jgi:protein SCO1/2
MTRRKYSPFSLLLLTAAIVAGILLLSSCHRTKAPVTKRYPFTGKVISIDTQDQSALIDGNEIPGFMDAMAMPYTVKPASDLKKLIPGDKISAVAVVVQSQNQNQDQSSPGYWLENVAILTHTEPPALPASALHTPAPGEAVPDFKFTNQQGKPISLKEYQGEVLFVTFIYTRCPFPDFCPRVSKNFAEIYNQIAADPSLSPKTHLLSISFDPEHDTPKVLRDYGLSVIHADPHDLFSRWEFAAPNATDLPQIAKYFALNYTPDGGMITHNLSTAVIGPDGKIVSWYHGGDWQPSDLIKDAKQALPAPGKAANQ